MLRNDFGGKVVWCTAEGPGGDFTCFCETEVGNFDVAVDIEEDVFGLQVTIYYVQTMQIVERQRYLCSVEFRYWIWKPLGKTKDLRWEWGIDVKLKTDIRTP